MAWLGRCAGPRPSVVSSTCTRCKLAAMPQGARHMLACLRAAHCVRGATNANANAHPRPPYAAQAMPPPPACRTPPSLSPVPQRSALTVAQHSHQKWVQQSPNWLPSMPARTHARSSSAAHSMHVCQLIHACVHMQACLGCPRQRRTPPYSSRPFGSPLLPRAAAPVVPAGGSACCKRGAAARPPRQWSRKQGAAGRALRHMLCYGTRAHRTSHAQRYGSPACSDTCTGEGGGGVNNRPHCAACPALAGS